MQYYLSAHQRPDLMSGGYLVVRAHDRQTTVGVSRIIQTMAGARRAGIKFTHLTNR